MSRNHPTTTVGARYTRETSCPLPQNNKSGYSDENISVFRHSRPKALNKSRRSTRPKQYERRTKIWLVLEENRPSDIDVMAFLLDNGMGTPGSLMDRISPCLDTDSFMTKVCMC